MYMKLFKIVIRNSNERWNDSSRILQHLQLTTLSIHFIACIWVFTVKYNSYGIIAIHMASLINTKHDLLQRDSLRHVYKFFWDILSYGTAQLYSKYKLLDNQSSWRMYLIDFNVLLYGDLVEGVHEATSRICCLEGKKVCKFKKMIYSLKQRPITWFSIFSHC